MDAVHDTRISRCYCVHGGALGIVPWIVETVDIINGIEFVPIQKQQSGLRRYVLGTCGGQALRDYTFIDELRALRNRAVLLATIPARPSLFGEVSLRGNQMRLRQLRRAAAVAPQDELPPYVEVELPCVEVDGCRFEKRIVKVKTPESANEGVHIEFLPDVMAHVRAAILSSGKAPSPLKRQKPGQQSTTGCKWEEKRAAYIVTVGEGNKPKFITVRGHDPEAARAHAKELCSLGDAEAARVRARELRDALKVDVDAEADVRDDGKNDESDGDKNGEGDDDEASAAAEASESDDNEDDSSDHDEATAAAAASQGEGCAAPLVR